MTSISEFKKLTPHTGIAHYYAYFIESILWSDLHSRNKMGYEHWFMRDYAWNMRTDCYRLSFFSITFNKVIHRL